MDLDDRSRLALHQRLAQVLGRDEAATLMAHLPPVGWHDVATKRDLDALGAELRGEIAGLRGEMAQQGAGLRGEMVQQGAELRGEIAGLRGEIHQEMSKFTRTVVLAVVATNAAGIMTAAGLAFAAARLAVP